MILAPVVGRMTKLVSRSIACAIILLLAACTALQRAEFTAREQQIAEVPGFKGIRAWADSTVEDFKRNGVMFPTPTRTLFVIWLYPVEGRAGRLVQASS